MNEFDKIKLDWDSIDKTDVAELREFFLRYSFFTTNNMAQLIKLSARNVRKYKKQAGFGKAVVLSPLPVNIKVPIKIDLPDNWDTPEWWRENYPKYGTWTLSRATGLSRPVIRLRINKYCGGLLTHEEATLSNHPRFDKEWLTEHYITQGKSLRACSKLAGVSPDTLAGWLNRLGIRVRSQDYGPIVG